MSKVDATAIIEGYLGREAALAAIQAFAEDGSRATSVAWEANG